MIKMEGLFAVVVLGVWIFTLADVAQTPERQIHYLPKVGWFVVVLLFPVLGSLGWFFMGRPQSKPVALAGERPVPQYPEYDRPGRAAADDPEKDAAFLQQVRDRAEAQRKAYQEQKKREAEGD